MKTKFIFILFYIWSGAAFSQSLEKKEDTTVRDFQVSIFPFVGINSDPANATVDVSFNILGGYIKEVRTAEFGGILNIESSNAGVCQLAGIGNIVGGNSKGLQAAGILNLAKSQKGLQIAGVINSDLKDAEKCQLAGVCNLVGGSSSGLQCAGVLNACRSQKGAEIAGVLNAVLDSAGPCQIAGVANITIGPADGFQGAGVMNLSHSITGAQIAGVLNATTNITGTQVGGVTNISWKTKGAQIAGVMNFTKEVEGTQIAGVLNLTWSGKGTQLGVVNLADTFSGIPVGVFSFVLKGYHKLGIYSDEVFYTNAEFRTGVTAFHNIFNVGIRPDNFSNPLWCFGYGIGSSFGQSSRLKYDIEVSAHHVNKGSFTSDLSELYKIYFGIDRQITPKMSIAAGLTYNLYLTDTNSHDYNDGLSDFMPYKFTNDNLSHGKNIKTWIGGRISLRFF